MLKIKTIFRWGWSLVLTAAAGGIIFYFWRPIAQWYWDYRPILGVDFYNTASYVAYLSRNFSWRMSGWIDSWWGGYPMALDRYPYLHFYLILPLLKFFSLIGSIQIYMLFSCFLYLFFAYLLFSAISRNRVLAVVLAIASSFSTGLYGALVWGGSLPYFATQLCLPLTLWLIVKFREGGNRRYFYAATLVLGVSLLGHVQVAFSFLLPISLALLMFYPTSGRLFSKLRLMEGVKYLLFAGLVGYPQLGVFIGQSPGEILSNLPGIFSALWKPVPRLIKLIPGVRAAAADTSARIVQAVNELTPAEQYQRDQLKRLITDTHPLFWYFLIAGMGLLVLSVMIGKDRRKSLKIIVFSLPVFWIIGYDALYAVGIGLFHGGWYRVFWPFPVSLGMVICFCWRDFHLSLRERFRVFYRNKIIKYLLAAFSFAAIIAPSYFLFRLYPAQSMLDGIETSSRRQQSSAFPDRLNMEVTTGEQPVLKKRLVPNWLNPDNTQYRLYEPDQRVNIWWSALFKMPLARGYIDPPPGDASGSNYWTAIALTQSGDDNNLIKTWNVPAEVAYHQALFLTDWFAIKYLEAEHEPSDSFNPLASHLRDKDIFVHYKEQVEVPGFAQLYSASEPARIAWHPDVKAYLTYYELKDELVSPIVHTTNLPVIGFIGARDAYYTFLRSLAVVNFNSQQAIPVYLGRYIDDVRPENLRSMDMAILYAYDYRNHAKSWKKIEDYVRQGGRLLIETGSDVKQTDSVNLPAGFPTELPVVFPIGKTNKMTIGQTWSLQSDTTFTGNLDWKAFGPPTIKGEAWQFSLPAASDGIRDGAQAILSNRETPLMAYWPYHEGSVIWSGMNLPYHIITYQNLAEGYLWQNILRRLLPVAKPIRTDFETKRISDNKIQVIGNNAKGVMIREQYYSGWKAGVISGKTRRPLPIYSTGPTYPGFMYVSIPDGLRDKQITVELTYRGNIWHYGWAIGSLITILILLDNITTGGTISRATIYRGKDWVKNLAGRWWNKDDYD